MNCGDPCPRRTQRRLLQVLGAAVVLAMSVSPAACRSAHEATPAATPLQANHIRHDLDPLTKRFPAIGNPTEATWMSGSLGDSSERPARVPGPSVYWIEAIITLQPETADALQTKYAPSPTGEPQLNENLRSEMPPGPFLTSKAMDKALSNTDWRSTTYFASDSNTLIIKSVDD